MRQRGVCVCVCKHVTKTQIPDVTLQVMFKVRETVV